MATTFTSALSLADAVSAYQLADASTKGKMRTAVTDAIVAAVMRGDMDTAQHLGAIKEALVPAKSTPTGPDYATIVSDMAATYEAAAQVLRHGISLSDEDPTLVVANQPGTVDEKLVAKLTTVRTRAARSENGAVAEFIGAYVTDEPRSAAELLNAAGADAAYRPSTGAIGACFIRVLNGSDEADGWTVQTVSRDGKKVRVAVAS
jgi:hypothetical protein